MAASGTTIGSVSRAAFSLVCLALAALLLMPRPAQAIINLYHIDNNIPIGSHPSWAGTDPGWDNFASSGKNYTYIGDGWVISALHVGVSTAQFLGQSYGPIPNQSYIVQNPTDLGVTLSGNSDLVLFRIDGEPALPDVKIASEPPPLGGEVVYIGRGSGRSTLEYHWQVNTSDPDNWVWTSVETGGNYHGYRAANPKTKRWGTNAIADDQQFYDSQEDPQLNGNNDADLNHIYSLNGRHVVSLLTTFEASGGTAHEAQAIPGNSGTAVFYEREGQWELSGIVNATFVYNDQYSDCGCNSAVYGNGTAFSDLSVYRDNIYSIINGHANYSVMGDINLDGVVTGNGSGDWATDDVTAFVEGWLYEQTEHSVTSWKKGDLNLDGKTSLADFVLMRDALLLSGSGAGASALTALLGGEVFAVPEPSSALLLMLAMAWLLRAARCRATSAAG